MRAPAVFASFELDDSRCILWFSISYATSYGWFSIYLMDSLMFQGKMRPECDIYYDIYCDIYYDITLQYTVHFCLHQHALSFPGPSVSARFVELVWLKVPVALPSLLLTDCHSL